MSTLQIRKLESGTFKHVDSIDGEFFLGRFNFKQELTKAFLVEAYGAKRREYVIEAISVYDYLGAEETFTNFTDLINRLTELGYTGIDINPIYPALNFLSNDATTYTPATLPLAGTEVAVLNDGTNWVKITWNNIKAQLALFFQYKLTAGTNITIDNTDPLNPIISASGGGGGGDEFHYIHMNQYIQYNQAPTTWYARNIGPQNVGWHASVNQHANSIGTNPLSFAAQSPAITLPFNCEVVEAFVFIQNNNGNSRTLNLRFYAYDVVAGFPANQEELLLISTPSNLGAKVITTDFTIPANTFTKGQRVTTVTNQSSDLTGVAVSWDVMIKLKKI